MAITFTKDYWLVNLKYYPKLGYAERLAQRNAEREALKAAGFQTEYRYPITQEARARKTAALIKNKTGVEMAVGKAFGMNF